MDWSNEMINIEEYQTILQQTDKQDQTHEVHFLDQLHFAN